MSSIGRSPSNCIGTNCVTPGVSSGIGFAFSFTVLYPIAVAVSVLIASTPAQAATDDENPRSAPPPPATRQGSGRGSPEVAETLPTRLRHTAIYFVMGIGAPTGVVGFEGVQHIGSNFEISAGVGRGLAASTAQSHSSVAHDLQWAVMPRLRMGGYQHAFTVGAGISGGNYGSGGEWFCDGSCPVRDYPTSYVLWGNFEIGGEHWWSNGIALRYFAGYAQGCSATSCTSASGASLSIPYFGIGFGYAF